MPAIHRIALDGDGLDNACGPFAELVAERLFEMF